MISTSSVTSGSSCRNRFDVVSTLSSSSSVEICGRNEITFERAPRQPAELLHVILDEASLWIAAGFRPLSAIDALRQLVLS